MTVKPGCSNHKKASSWISCLSICARGVFSKTELDHDQIMVLFSPEMHPPTKSSGVISMTRIVCDFHYTFIILSIPSTFYNLTILFLVENVARDPQKDNESCQLDPQHNYSQPPLTHHKYFTKQPLPTKRGSPRLNYCSSVIDSNNSCVHERFPAAPSSMVQGTLTFFIGTISLPASSTSLTSLNSKATCHNIKVVENLNLKVTVSTPVHPSLLKLADDLLAHMNNNPAMTNELRLLKPKLEVCLLIHGKSVA